MANWFVTLFFYVKIFLFSLAYATRTLESFFSRLHLMNHAKMIWKNEEHYVFKSIKIFQKHCDDVTISIAFLLEKYFWSTNIGLFHLSSLLIWDIVTIISFKNKYRSYSIFKIKDSHNIYIHTRFIYGPYWLYLM